VSFKSYCFRRNLFYLHDKLHRKKYAVNLSSEILNTAVVRFINDEKSAV